MHKKILLIGVLAFVLVGVSALGVFLFVATAGLRGAAVDKLGAETAQNVKVLFVTADPKRDTPQRVQEYVNHFNKDLIGLSGTKSQLVQVWNAYCISANLHSFYGTDMPLEDHVHDVKLLLE